MSAFLNIFCVPTVHEFCSCLSALFIVFVFNCFFGYVSCIFTNYFICSCIFTNYFVHFSVTIISIMEGWLLIKRWFASFQEEFIEGYQFKKILCFLSIYLVLLALSCASCQLKNLCFLLCLIFERCCPLKNHCLVMRDMEWSLAVT